MKNLEVGSNIRVLMDGKQEIAKIRRIGTYQPEGNGFRIATLDVGGKVAYCVIRETELAGG